MNISHHGAIFKRPLCDLVAPAAGSELDPVDTWFLCEAHGTAFLSRF